MIFETLRYVKEDEALFIPLTKTVPKEANPLITGRSFIINMGYEEMRKGYDC
jgi:hypothetical protein